MGSLHWPSAGGDLGPGGISNVELLILYELWAERFQFEKAVPRCKRVDRPISVSAVPLVQALFGDLVGFLVLCANHSRLRQIGWVQSGHGLTSRPRETSDVRFLDELLFLFGYPPGTLPLILYVSVCT